VGVGRGRSTSRSCGPVRGSGHRLHLSDARGPDRERPAARDPPGTDESPHPVFRAWRAEGKCAVGASPGICPSWAIRSIIVCGLVHSHVQPPGRVAPACSRRSHCRHRLRYSQSARGVPDELIRRRESFQAISAEICPAVAKPSTVCLCNGALPAATRFQGSAARRPPGVARHASEPTAGPQCALQTGVGRGGRPSQWSPAGVPERAVVAVLRRVGGGDVVRCEGEYGAPGPVRR